MNRKRNIAIAKDANKVWDVAVIGGGASGLGVALDAVSRGLSVILVEKVDFAKGTSSRSTKLLHGGVRYLAQGNVGLVLEALRERGIMMRNAPHVSGRQSFIIPIYSLWDQLKYAAGLKLYDLMAGGLRIGSSRWLSKSKVIKKLPTIKQEGLRGGVVYYDGQFDDTRLALNVAQTCAEEGACILNYTGVSRLLKDERGLVNGIQVQDELDGATYPIQARTVVNATGVFSDAILKMDDPQARPSIVPSQGIHLTMDLSFLGGRDALMIPETSDGRVLFGIPWHGKLVVGTTDTPGQEAHPEPKPLKEEIDFILETCAAYLAKAPTRADVQSVFAGLRPLAAPKAEGARTKEISRSHKIVVSGSQLVSIVGGKWTTFRQIGEDTVDALVRLKNLAAKQSTSKSIQLHGYEPYVDKDTHFGIYGQDAGKIRQLMYEQPGLEEKLQPNYPYTKAEVKWMVRKEMACRVEDVLARRLRILFLDAQAAIDMAPAVAEIMAEELGKDESWRTAEVEAFNRVASRYLIAKAEGAPTEAG